jgi:hypothetical protein
MKDTFGVLNETIENLGGINEKVAVIASDSVEMGKHVDVLDKAMKNVESSNHDMVESMNVVYEIMNVLKQCVEAADVTSKNMLEKYEKTAENVNRIEGVVGNLVEELDA